MFEKFCTVNRFILLRILFVFSSFSCLDMSSLLDEFSSRNAIACSPYCLEIRGGRDRCRYTLQPSPIPSSCPPCSGHFCSFASLSGRFSAFSSACLPANALRAFPCTQFVLFELERGESSISISLMLSPILHEFL